jgi:hypothetical protein
VNSFGCAGRELLRVYWILLTRHTNIRTVKDEQHRQFCSSVLVPLPTNDRLAQLVFNAIKACLAGCEYTETKKPASLVRAGNLHLTIQYSREAQEYKIHEKCIRKDSAIDDLGLPTTATTGQVVFHMVTQLFEEALHQRLDGTSSTWIACAAKIKKQARMEAQQKLLVYATILDSLVVSSCKSVVNSLLVSWAGFTTKHYKGELVVQLHREDSRSYMKELQTNGQCECFDSLKKNKTTDQS